MKRGRTKNLVAAIVISLVFALAFGLDSTAALAQRRGGHGGNSQEGRSFSGRSFSGAPARGFSGNRRIPRVQPFTRGRSFVPQRVEPRFRGIPRFSSVPSFGFYGYYAPYSYVYPYPSCGFYDQWGYWHADPYCSSYRYYGYAYPY